MAIVTFSDICLSPSSRKKRGRDVFTVNKPIEIRINDTVLTVIPDGYESDGASLPWYARFRWSSWGKYAGPALLHDYLLENTEKPKWEVDTLFYLALRSNEVSALEAMIFYLAVRIKRKRD